MKNYFYCYSYKLMRFLKLQGLNYSYKGSHPNGNHFWAFPSSDQLNKELENWNVYKLTFQNQESNEEGGAANE